MDPGSTKKPLFARKTMAPSNRKQLTMLKQMRGTRKLERTANNSCGAERPNRLEGVDPTEVCFNGEALQDLLSQLYEMDSCAAVADVPVEVRLDVTLLTPHPRPQTAAAKPSSEEGTRKPLQSEQSCAAQESGVSHVRQEEESIQHTIERDAKEPLAGEQSRAVLEQEPVASHSHQETIDTPVLPDESPRKRRMLEREEAAPSKVNLSPDSGMGKIKPIIQDYISVSMEALSHKLEHLNGRIDLIQCHQKHEGITIKIVKRISKLDKRVNGVIAVQKAELSKKARLPGSDSSNMILNCPRPVPVQISDQSVPTDGKDLPGAAESLPSRKASRPADESSDDVVCIEVENHHQSAPVAKVPDGQQNKKADGAAGTSVPPPTQSEVVIDLTEEWSASQPALGNEEEEEETTPSQAKAAAEAPKSEAPPMRILISSNEVLTEVQLPPLPKVRLLPETVTDFKGTLPPQKMELSVANLLNPKRVALGFDVSHADRRCALLESIHVFFFVSNPHTKSAFSWTPLKVIQARPLPMFISLGDLPTSGTYYFTMHSKDIYGRYGPFCDIRALSVT